MWGPHLKKADKPLTPEQELLPFAEVPDEYHITAFGVPYIRNPDEEGGFLYVTRWGWHRLMHLRPENWYHGRRFVKEGERLRGSTGTVYRVPSRPEGAAPMDLLIKVSRLAEDVPGKLAAEVEELRVLQEASFNSPFEEFGLVEELRASSYGPPDLHVRTKRPLAIYCTPRDLPEWQLGRKHSDFQSHWKELDKDQSLAPEGMRIHLMKSRQYFTLYAWVHGIDAQAALERGLLTERELNELTERVNRELALKGFRILDNKPKHFILRPCAEKGGVIRHHGRMVYVQIDFELLQRTQEYRQYVEAKHIETLESYLDEYTSL